MPIERAQLSLSTSHISNRKSKANLCVLPLPVAKDFSSKPVCFSEQPLEHETHNINFILRPGREPRETGGEWPEVMETVNGKASKRVLEETSGFPSPVSHSGGLQGPCKCSKGLILGLLYPLVSCESAQPIQL